MLPLSGAPPAVVLLSLSPSSLPPRRGFGEASLLKHRHAHPHPLRRVVVTSHVAAASGFASSREYRMLYWSPRGLVHLTPLSWLSTLLAAPRSGLSSVACCRIGRFLEPPSRPQLGGLVLAIRSSWRPVMLHRLIADCEAVPSLRVPDCTVTTQPLQSMMHHACCVTIATGLSIRLSLC